MIRNSDVTYGSVAIFFHWSIAALFIGQIGLGWFMLEDTDPARQFWLFQWHKSFGFLILALAALRLIWTLANRRPVEPDSLTAFEKIGARAAHWLLYAALFVVPLTGWAIASTSPLQIPSYAFNLVVIPHLPMNVSEAGERFWADVHAVLAYGAAIVAGLHILAALRHHFWLRDGILLRITRPSASHGTRK